MTATATMLDRIRSILGGDTARGARALALVDEGKEPPEGTTEEDLTAAQWFATMGIADYVALAQLELLERLTLAVESIEMAQGGGPRQLQPLPACCPECDAPPLVRFRVDDDGWLMQVECSRYSEHEPAMVFLVTESGLPDWVDRWNDAVAECSR